MKRKIAIMLCLAMLGAALAGGCSSKKETDVSGTEQTGQKGATAGASSGGTIEVEFWSAPNQNQFDFWSKKVEEFNAAGIQYDNKTVQVEVQMTPESTSSEAAIQNAIATGTIPAASENISLSFAAVLADSGVVYDIDQEEFYRDIISNRVMSEAAARWEIGGKQYVIPVYINPVSLQWNVKALKALGFVNPPKTMDEYKAVIQAFVDNPNTMKEMGVDYMVSTDRFLNESGYQCGYDFQMMYSTYTNGESWIDGNTLTVDREAAINTFEFWGLLGNTVNVAKIEGAWTQDNIPVLMDIGKPWDAISYMEAGKVYGEDFVFGPIPVQSSDDQAYCYADTKGITFYKASNVTEEQHQGAVAFISWVYSAKNSSNTDLEWLNSTSMLPVRGDLLENATFTETFDNSAELSYLAANINYAVPLPAHLKADDIEVALRVEGFIPYMAEAVKNKPLNPLDASSYVDNAISAMKEAGGLE
jgi:multiple sugar transport system substrate-binding protein